MGNSDVVIIRSVNGRKCIVAVGIVTVKNCSYVDQQKISDLSMVGDLGFPGIWKELFHSANVKTSGVAELDPCGTGLDLFLKLTRV